MAKPKPATIDSGSCIVRGSCPHEGEEVVLFPVPSVGEFSATLRLRTLGERAQHADQEPDGGAGLMTDLDRAFEEALGYLADRLVGWTWTNDAGRPLPQPDGTPGPLRCLRPEEINWLMSAGQRGEEAKDDAGSA